MPEPMSPDLVNAIVRNPDDPRFPCQITVFCDRCRTEVTSDYIVHEDMTGVERLEVARESLRRDGWACDDDGDFCRTCVAVNAFVAEWNCRVPVGTQVRFWPGFREGEGRQSKTRSLAWVLPSGAAVVMVEGYSGGIALTHVQVIEDGGTS